MLKFYPTKIIHNIRFSLIINVTSVYWELTPLKNKNKIKNCKKILKNHILSIIFFFFYLEKLFLNSIDELSGDLHKSLCNTQLFKHLILLFKNIIRKFNFWIKLKRVVQYFYFIFIWIECLILLLLDIYLKLIKDISWLTFEIP